MPTPLIHNPHAGGGRGARAAKKAAALLAERGVDTRPIPTSGPLDAGALARRLAEEGEEVILVVGGDGTLSEAADGILRSDARPKVGLLPAGTGNAFVRDFGLDTLERAADAIARGEERGVDAGVVRWKGGERHFVNVFGSGFMANVCDLANRRYKWMGGASYSGAVFPQLARLRSPLTRLEMDGRVVEEPLTLVAVCNTSFTGKGMHIAPMADPQDGVLDIVALREVTRPQLLRLFPRLFNGSHVGDERVLVERAQRVRIEPAEPSPLLGDGEVYGQTPVEVETLPKALRLLA